MIERIRTRITWVDLAAATVLVLLLVVYLYNLTGWRIYDDEGEYLYQVWRMTDGALPYRDFLTPQLPAFLFSGLTVMSLTGPSLWAMRFFAVLLAFGAATLLYTAARRRGAALTGLLAASLFLLHPDIFRETRIFRNEPLFLFLVTCGLVLATWPGQKRRRYRLIGSGFFFALATMSKLFGLLPAAGVGLWLIWQAWTDEKPLRKALRPSVYFGTALVVTLGLLVAFFVWLMPDFLDLVVGHHLDQGSSQTIWEIVTAKLSLYTFYFSLYPPFLTLAIASAALGLKQADWRRGLLWQIPTVLVFLFLSRQLGQRHFMYLLPSLVLLVGHLLAQAMSAQRQPVLRLTAALVVPAMVLTWLPQNLDRASWTDTDTVKLLQVIREQTTDDDVILADDIGLAFYARRPTTYSGAALSHGAITSGQITGELLISEMVRDNVQLVLIDESLLTGNHLVFLRDYPRFHRFLEQNFRYHGQIRRDFQEIAIWIRQPAKAWQTTDILAIDEAFEGDVRFGEVIGLEGYTIYSEHLAPGDSLGFTIFWEAAGATENYWSVFAHLVDAEGGLVAQHDKVPYDGLYPPTRWWAGQIVDDDFAIQLPTNLPAGTYYLELGLYDHLTGERLTVHDAAGQPLQESKVRLPHPIVVTAN
ncbi:MAG: phospholipid carrier-dependent glycosyltransferase [Candidatus Promineifilaceae bacterium]|nr:phospholipid carrier-dependent glycosyltransferase [Candidatus Promineifilaceae bacterium]